ncbi:hypothetical protein NL676_011555 [Syzygium grande]|nr:hypothetical protein NL676_011555 [Syzygium grande]
MGSFRPRLFAWDERMGREEGGRKTTGVSSCFGGVSTVTVVVGQPFKGNGCRGGGGGFGEGCPGGPGGRDLAGGREPKPTSSCGAAYRRPLPEVANPRTDPIGIW